MRTSMPVHVPRVIFILNYLLSRALRLTLEVDAFLRSLTKTWWLILVAAALYLGCNFVAMSDASNVGGNAFSPPGPSGSRTFFSPPFTHPSISSTPRSMTPLSSTDESYLATWKSAQPYGRSAVWKYFQRVADERGEGHVCIVPVPGTNGKSAQPCGERKGKNYSLLNCE